MGEITKVRIGIDPGKKGFITILDGGVLEFHQLPTIGKEYDYIKLIEIFDKYFFEPDYNIHICIENNHGRGGWSANVNESLGESRGMLKMLMHVYRFPYTMVTPAKWQKVAHEGIPLLKRLSKTGKTMIKDTKKMSEIAVKRLYPNVDLRRTTRCINYDENKIDSLLICYYCNIKY
jgi:hypothetical protein